MRRAQTIQKKAAKVGFDWADWRGSFDKIQEELNELKVEIEAGDIEKAQEEFGDLIFSMANLARSLKFEADDSLALANKKNLNAVLGCRKRGKEIQTRMVQLLT